jgi:hypothetical protein
MKKDERRTKITEEKEEKIPYAKICKPFEEAREFVHKLGIKNVDEWIEYCKSGNKPNEIPHKPERIYRNKGWKSYGDWFGVWNAKKTAENKKADGYLPFEEAKKFIHMLKIRNVKEWFKYCDSGRRPKDIPYNPDRIYKNSGWKSYADWLGTTHNDPDLKYMEFEDARRFVRNLRLEGTRGWNEYCKSGKKPDNIPFAPYAVYADDGWVSMEDWLGTEKERYSGRSGKSEKRRTADSNEPFAKFRKRY